jgi:hypothetical protein
MPLITVKYGLPFVSISLRANGQTLNLTTVLLDSGSAACVFRTELLEAIGVVPDRTDTIRFMTGIGGREAVIEKQIDAIEIGNLGVTPFIVQIGELDYGFAIDGILGSDFLFEAGAQVNFKSLSIEKE